MLVFVNTMAPLTPLWECYDIETCEMWEKEEMVCVLLPISWVEVFLFMRKVFQTKLNAERCDIKILYWAPCILLTIVQRLYPHYQVDHNCLKNNI